MELTQGDRQSAVWHKLYGYFEDELESARTRLEKTGQSEQATAEIRGQIKAIRNAMALNDQKPFVE